MHLSGTPARSIQRILPACSLLLALVLLTSLASASAATTQAQFSVLLAQAESESRHTFRGGEQQAQMGIAPLLVHLLPVQGTTSSPQAARQLFTTIMAASPLLVSSNDAHKMDAALCLTPAGNGFAATIVTHPPLKTLASTTFRLPEQQPALVAALEGYARLVTAKRLAGTMPLHGFSWKVQVFSPIPQGQSRQQAVSLQAQGIFWQQTGTFVVPFAGVTQARTGRTLVGFHFTNEGSTDYYVQLLNYTEQGQVTPVLAAPLRVAAGTQVPAPLHVDLGEEQEHIKAVISQSPMGFAVLAQEGLLKPTGPHPSSFGAAPAAEEFTTLVVTFPK